MTEWLEELERWHGDGTMERLVDLAKLSGDYHSDSPEPDGVRLVRVQRSSGHFSDAVLTFMGHAGRSCFVKLRREYGGKLVDTSDILKWPWLDSRVPQ